MPAPLRAVTVVGARPQFVKAAALGRALRAAGHDERMVHTGQHYDPQLSDVFFAQLEIPPPAHHLGVGSGPHGAQTARMLAGLEPVLAAARPDVVVIYGDTNSTLAAALAAAKLRLPVAHVEAGLRSFNRAMPEELNRVVADHLSELLFCPSEEAARNLGREGITRGVHVVGDVMADALAHARARADEVPDPLAAHGLAAGRYLAATLHRAENTDDPGRLARILDALDRLDEPVLLPLHPRTRAALAPAAWRPSGALRLVEPLGYLEMIRVVRDARLVLTDSGGLQKEAYWLGVPCVTLREETEWVETVAAGWNVLAGADPQRIGAAVRTLAPPAARPPLYGDGRAAERAVALLAPR